MEKAYEDLKNKGHNNVDNLIQWMKEAKVIDAAKEKEDKARKLFDDCADKTNVELTKFKEVVTSLAKEQKKSVDDFAKLLTAQAPTILNAFEAAASAFKDAMKNK